MRDFYEIEYGGSYNDHGNGIVTFIIPKGVISVVTIAVQDEIRVSATNYSNE